MKKNTHPEYQNVLFIDTSTGQRFICGSTLKTDQTESFEGKEYPVCWLSISSTSHPFFTGDSKFVDAEGRVDKFRKRYSRGKKKEEEENLEQQNKEGGSEGQKKRKDGEQKP